MNSDNLRLRNGVLGAWDRVVGPGMSRAENILVIASALAGGLFAGVRMAQTTGFWFLIALAALIGLDVIGGAVCNATATTRAWYHRPGQGWREHMLFVAPHLVYVAAIAGLVRGASFDAPYAAVFGLGILMGSAAILAAPDRLKSPIAFAVFLLVLNVVAFGFGPTRGLEWFAPALLLKLLVGHLAPTLGFPSDRAES